MSSHSDTSLNSLEDLLSRLDAQADTLSRARHNFFAKEAGRKHFEAVMIRTADGTSHAQKVTNAEASEEWLGFHKNLAHLDSLYEYQKLKYEILKLKFQATYLMEKQDSDLIKKQL